MRIRNAFISIAVVAVTVTAVVIIPGGFAVGTLVARKFWLNRRKT